MKNQKPKATTKQAGLPKTLRFGIGTAICFVLAGLFTSLTAWFEPVPPPTDQPDKVAESSRQKPVVTALKATPKLIHPGVKPNQATAKTEVDELIEERGHEGAAATIAWRFEGTAQEQYGAMENLSASWAKSDPVAASGWLAINTGAQGQTPGMLDAEIWEAAVSGYIEGVSDESPEIAERLAGLLRLQTVSPDSPSNNEPEPSDEVTRNPKMESEEPIEIETEIETGTENVESQESSADKFPWKETLSHLREIHGVVDPN